MQPSHSNSRRAHISKYILIIYTFLLLSPLWIMLLASTLPDGTASSAAINSQVQNTYTGQFFMVLGGNTPLYYLQTDAGDLIEFQADDKLMESAGGVWNLNRQKITLVGQDIGLSRRIIGRSVVVATSIKPNTTNTSNQFAPLIPEPVQIAGSRPFANILCKFPDITNEPESTSYFSGLMSNTYPGMDNYFREASYGTINLTGTVVLGWYTLPQARAYYIPGGSLDFGRIATDCTALANASVNFNNFQGINLMFNYELDSYAWGGSWYLTLDGTSKLWPMTWMPPWGYGNQGVLAHEMGHAFGMPHSGDSNGTTYNNVWDVMSDTWTNCGLLSSATYGCLGQHEIAPQKDIPGWIPASRLYNTPGGSQSITLERLAQPNPGNYLMAKIPINCSTTKFYSVEARYRVGYDMKVPTNGVVIHNVDTTRLNPAWVMDPSGGSTQDALYLPSPSANNTFTDVANNITITVTGATASGFKVTFNSPNTLNVTKTTDDGLNGSLSCALKSAHAGDTINLVPDSGTSFTLSQTLVVPAGVTLHGGCNGNGPTITINGPGAQANPSINGISLSGGANLNGVKIANFPGKPLVIASGDSAVSCVKLTK